MYGYSIGQFIFDRTFFGLIIALRFLWKLIIYAPLWFTGYMISTYILDNQASAFAWLGLIFLFSISLYQIMFFIKGLIIGCMANKKLLWLPLFIICFLFTSVIPVWLMFDSIHELMSDLSAEYAGTLSWIASIALGIFMYSRYHFLTDMAPLAAYQMYQFGLTLSSSSMIGERSPRFI